MKSTLNNLKKVWQYFKPYKFRLILFIIVTFLIGAFGILSPLITAEIITNITDNKLRIVLYMAMLLLFVNILVQILTYFNNKNFYKFQGKAVKSIRSDYCESILNIQNFVFQKKGSGVFLNRFSTDLVTFSYIFYQIILDVNSIVINIGVYVLIFLINIYIGIYFVISSIILFVLNKVRIKKKNETWRELKLIDEKNQSVFSEMLRGFVDLKVLNLQNGMIKYVNNNLDKNRKKSYEIDMINSKYDFLGSLIQNVFRFLFLFLSFIFINNKSLSIANFLILFLYQDKINNIIYSIAHITNELNLFNLCTSNILEILSEDGFKKEKYGQKSISSYKGELVFKDVSFSYDNDFILDKINFKIKPKQKVAIIGKSGSGKSTIVNLISRLYDVDSGKIMIDNIDIKDLDKESLRNSVSLITQNPYIFNLTIKENLTLSRRNISDDDIIEKCKLVGIHDFIKTLPDGYDTMLDENGVNLSGGQKQRLAIARALLRNSKIIIFDEATNSLDKETKNVIKESIDMLKEKCTLIIISHSFDTIIDSDNIILIDNGKIIDQGTHKQLIKKNELYKKLYNED